MTYQEKNELISKISRNVNEMILYAIKTHVDKEAPEQYSGLLEAQARFEQNLTQLLKDI